MYGLYKSKNWCKTNIIQCGFKFRRRFRVEFSRKLNSFSNFELDAGYVPHNIEKNSNEANYFHSKENKSKKFSLVLPPPNITGTLHLGHALTSTIQDVLVRWNKMKGIETTWIPGLDHAGIATQVVVEKRIWGESHKTRHEIGRDQFQKEVWKWKEEKARKIGEQMRALNLAINWDREVFTLDQQRSNAVTTAFIRLFESGLVYRADQLVNWSCILQSAISDIEVEHLSIDGPTDVPVPGYENPIQFGTLVHFAYKLHDSDEEIVVATTRPETMLGDVAVAVNPQDDRYARYVGRYLWHPFRKDMIPIIADHFVDPNFGTGAVKLTPAHDHNDFEAGRRHSLNTIQVIDEKGNLTAACGNFSGIRRFDARNIILSELERLKLLRSRQNHQMIVPICSRSKDIIEFLTRPQWFVKCNEMATRAVDDVKTSRLTIEPKHFEKTWFSWLENIRDWCISRQLWWGHQVPAYLCYDKSNTKNEIWIAAHSITDAVRKAAIQLNVSEDQIFATQDEDVLDTWFSSALQPFSVFGWPQQSDDFTKYYPLDIMETGHDILFFWVARMVMLGNELTGQLPFNKILLHGIICDAQGRKMSKSLGNVVAPENIITGCSLQTLEDGSKANYAAGILSEDELKRAIQNQKKMFPQGIPECGADALRFTLLSHNIKNHFINFDVSECYTNKLFGNKIWQATKFTKLWFENISKENGLEKIPQVGNLSFMDRWILSRLSCAVDRVNESLEKYEFHIGTAALKNFLYYEFCDNYLESTKRGLRTVNCDIAAGHCWTLITCLDIGLRLLAPFMPALAQHLHQHLPLFPNCERDNFNFPQTFNWRNEQLEKDVESVLNVIVAIRRLKKMFNIVAKHKSEVHIVSSSDHVLANYLNVMEDLTATHRVTITTHQQASLIRNTVQDNVYGNTTIYLVVPEDLMTSIQLDKPKMEKKKQKLQIELDKLNKMISGKTYKINVTVEAQEVHSKKIAVLEEKLARINYVINLVKS